MIIQNSSNLSCQLSLLSIIPSRFSRLHLMSIQNCFEQILETTLTKQYLYGHLPPISQTIQVGRKIPAGHCWQSKNQLIRDILLWISTHKHNIARWPGRTYILQLCPDRYLCECLYIYTYIYACSLKRADKKHVGILFTFSVLWTRKHNLNWMNIENWQKDSGL